MPINDVQITNKQHAVPQNIMDVEFKIIGDLTMRQFFYLMAFGGMAYGVFAFVDNIFRLPLIMLLALMGIALAFVPLEERGLDQWIINFFRAVYTSNQSVWRKTPEIAPAFNFQNLNVVKHELITLAPANSRRKLEEFLEVQKTQVERDPLDMQEGEYIKMVRDAFYNEGATAHSSTAVAVEPEISTEPQISLTPEIPIEEPIQPIQQQTRPEKPETEPKIIITPPTIKEAVKEKQPDVKPVEQPQPQVQIQPKPVTQQIKLKRPTVDPLTPITPDQHSGRKFTNLLPEQGELILPIRGELVLQSSEEEQIEDDIEKKAEQLKKLLEQIKKEEGIETSPMPQKRQIDTPQIPQPAPMKQATQSQDPVVPVHDDTQIALKKLQEENLRLTQQIERLRQEITRTQTPQEKTQKIATLQKLQEEKTKTTKNYSVIKESIQDLKEKVFVRNAIQEPAIDEVSTGSQKSNIVSGTVYDPDHRALDGLILIIKDERGEAKRAIKTNQLGRFTISNPLTNGRYTIETDKSNKTDLFFDIMEVTATGEVLKEIEIVGRRKA
jgi:hypothetical protein